MGKKSNEGSSFGALGYFTSRVEQNPTDWTFFPESYGDSFWEFNSLVPPDFGCTLYPDWRGVLRSAVQKKKERSALSLQRAEHKHGVKTAHAAAPARVRAYLHTLVGHKLCRAREKNPARAAISPLHSKPSRHTTESCECGRWKEWRRGTRSATEERAPRGEIAVESRMKDLPSSDPRQQRRFERLLLRHPA